MITIVIAGAHTIVYASDPGAARTFFRDVLGFAAVDAGDGWLIFALPPGELAVHPGSAAGHELFFMCHDIEATVAELDATRSRVHRARLGRGLGAPDAIGGSGCGRDRPLRAAPSEPARRLLETWNDVSEYDPTLLPTGLPVPTDDGAADHLEGLELPSLRLESTYGELDLAAEAAGLLVLYMYPRTGRPGVEPPAAWDETPGARGCTPQSCGYRDHGTELRELGARVVGLSAQPLEDQREVAERLALPHPVVADPELRLADALGLPTFDFGGQRLYRRLALVAERGRIVKVFYPVFPPDENAAEVVAWLRG